jgi:hypothetical protein
LCDNLAADDVSLSLHIKIGQYLLCLHIKKQLIQPSSHEVDICKQIKCNLFRKCSKLLFKDTYGKGFCGYIVAAQLQLNGNHIQAATELPVELLKKFGENLSKEMDSLNAIDHTIKKKLESFLYILNEDTAAKKKTLPVDSWLNDDNFRIICHEKVNLFTGNRNQEVFQPHCNSLLLKDDKYLLYGSRKSSLGLSDLLEVVFNKDKANIALAENHFFFCQTILVKLRTAIHKQYQIKF